MNRLSLAVGTAALVLTAAACSRTENTQPTVVTVTPTVSTTPETTTPSTEPETTEPETSEPGRPDVTAVPMALPVAAKAFTVPREVFDETFEAAADGSRKDTTPRQVGTIQIPKLGLSTVLHTAGDQFSQQAVDKAVNLSPIVWGNKVLPGEVGNTVIAGHRTSHTAPFRHLDRLEADDPIIVTGPDGTSYTYLVKNILILGVNDWSLQDARDGATLTLFACHPPGSTRQKIVVYADLKA